MIGCLRINYSYVNLQEIANPQYISQLVVLLVTHYIPLTQDDLEEWMEAPEEFMMELDTENYDESVKVSIEYLTRC